MGATYFHDPNAQARSPMLRQLTVCDGQRDGHECKHYWRQVVKKDTLNPDNLRKGETYRYCLRALNAPDHNMAMFINGTSELAVECTEYRKDRRRPHDPNVDAYDPLTPEEIQALQDGKALARFKPRRWWEFWKPAPSVRVEFLTPEEVAAEERKRLAAQTRTQDAENSILHGDVLAGNSLSMKDDPTSTSKDK